MHTNASGTNTLDRRRFLAGTIGGTALSSKLPGAEAAIGFRHRGYLGWITDLAADGEPDAAWPSMRLDKRLLRDYAQTFSLMDRIGFNEATIWGLYVSRAWPVDVRSAVTPERGKLVEQLIEAAHRSSVKVFSGLGVYSWGFDDIIKANPKLSRTNPHAMCASVPDSWEWMRRVTDFVFDRFPVDGVSLQSADQGRCTCDQCRRIPDAEYHARLNIRVCEYIRSKWRGKTVAINGWGMDFSAPETAEALVGMSKVADYIIDVRDSSRAHDVNARRRLCESLNCDFGTIGGPQVEPPQHWPRDRWFLPTPRSQGEHLQALYQDGGRACEYFFHALANPADEISFYLTGKALRNPGTPWREHLRSTVAELYSIEKPQVVDQFCSLILKAENAYMDLVPPIRSGTISMEPLVSSKPGPPVYLTKRLNAEQRRTYLVEMSRVETAFRALAPQVPEKTRMNKILQCLGNVKRELEAL